MFGRSVQLLVTLLMLTLLASCGSLNRRPIDRPLYYDVRDVAVVGMGSVPPRIIAGVDRRLRESIFATVRSEALPRVVLTVTVRDFGPIGMYGNRRMGATFRVVATSVDSGVDIAAGTYQVMSATDVAVLADESLAEEVAARVRYAFSLAMPQAMVPSPRPRMTRPGDYYAPSTPFGRSPQPEARAQDSEPRIQRTIGGTAVRPAPVAPAVPAAPARAEPSPSNPVSPVETIMPRVDRPLGPVPTPRPSRPEEKPVTTPADIVGTNTEQGASGAIQLRPSSSTAPSTEPAPAAPAACDPATDAACKPVN